MTRVLSMCWQVYMIYAASVAMLAWPLNEGPAWLLAVGAWVLCRTPGREGILWLMAIGLLLDALSQTKLGIHLALCGLTASALSVSVLPLPRGRWWKPACAAAVLAGINHLGAAILQNFDSGITPGEITSRWSELLQSAGYCAGSTALLVIIATAVCRVAQRAWNNGSADNRWELGNQWARLTET